MKTEMKPGDRVAYSVKFLRSISAFTGAMPFARGTIESITSGLATIKWDKNADELPRMVNTFNLVLEKKIGLQV